MRALSLFAAALVAAAAFQPAIAERYPSRPIKIVVPSSPGGASDLVARMVAIPLGDKLGEPFVVENRVTSGGIIATQQVADSEPDGYTLLVTFDTFASNDLLFHNLKWNPIRDFAPVMQICRYPQLLLVNPALHVKSLAEFVDLAKQHGADLNYGSAGPASSSRLAYELFKDVAGIETVPVHYRGGGPAIRALLAGQVQAMLIQGGGSIQAYVRSGKLVALAQSSLQPSKFYPSVPTIAQTYPGFHTESWVAMFAPAKTPKAVIAQLHDTMAASLTDPAVHQRFESQGCDVVAGSPHALGTLLREDHDKWAGIIRKKHITIE